MKYTYLILCLLFLFSCSNQTDKQEQSNYIKNLENRIESSILDAVQSWIPNININQIIFDYDNNDIDNNRIALDIKFSLISNPNLTETIQINVNN